MARDRLPLRMSSHAAARMPGGTTRKHEIARRLAALRRWIDNTMRGT